MYYLFIDTCVWIDLSNKHIEVCRKLTDLVEQEKVRLIVPQIVIEEWHRNKESKIAIPRGDSIRSMVKHARNISEHLEQEEAESFKKILDRFERNTPKIESWVLQHINAVDALFNHSSTVKLIITEKEKLQAVDFALEKKAPFKNKNSMADALILLSFVNYVAEQNLTDSIFVSSNTEDFSSTQNKSEIHSDLKELFDEHEIRYFSNIGIAVNEIKAGLISDEYIDEVEETLQLEELQRIILEGIKPNAELFASFQEAWKPNAELMASLQEAVKPNAELMASFQEAWKPNAELMASLQEAWKPNAELMASLQEAWKPNAELMASLQEAVKPKAELMASFQEAWKPNAELIASLQEAWKPNAELMASIQDAVKPKAELMASLQDAVKPKAELMASLQEAWKPNAELMASLQDAVKPNAELMASLQDAWKPRSEIYASLLDSAKLTGGLFESIQTATTIREITKLNRIYLQNDQTDDEKDNNKTEE